MSNLSIQQAARALVEKLDEAMPFIDRMCARQQNRGQPYSGPQLGDELEALRAVLVVPVSGGSCDTALETSGDVEALGWRPIETCPQDGFFLVYEDEAMRTLLRIKGIWHKCGYPAIVTPHWNDALVGDDARRMLPVGHRLEIRDGCCEEPTHWMQLPKPPSAAPDARE